MRVRETERSLALEQARHDISNRIRRFCVEFTPAEFDRLVEQMARIDVRYRLRDDWGFHELLHAERH